MADEELRPDTKSARMRLLYENGMSIADIARELKTYYSFVHRVIQRHKKNHPELNTREAKQPRHPSKSSRIRRLYDDGKTIDQIAGTLGLDREEVYSIVRKYKQAKRTEQHKNQGGE